MGPWYQQVKRQLALAIFSLGSLLAALPAQADFIAEGSTYNFLVYGNSSGNTSHGSVIFDGLWESFTRTTVDGGEIELRINESQFDLGGGMHAVEIIILGGSDIYPVLNETGGLNVGYLDTLDLLGDFSVTSAVLSMFIDGGLLASADFYAAFPGYFANDPWDGAFMHGSGTGGAWSNLGGRGVNEVRLRVTVQAIPVPEPTALTLLGLGLAALLWRRAVQPR